MEKKRCLAIREVVVGNKPRYYQYDEPLFEVVKKYRQIKDENKDKPTHQYGIVLGEVYLETNTFSEVRELNIGELARAFKIEIERNAPGPESNGFFLFSNGQSINFKISNEELLRLHNTGEFKQSQTSDKKELFVSYYRKD